MKSIFNLFVLIILITLTIGVAGTSPAYAAMAWEQVGVAGFSADEAANISLAFDNDGIPYVAYADGYSDGKASVMKFNGTAWEQVGVAGFSAGEALYTSLAFDGGMPYVAYADGGNDYKASVMKYNGTSWEQMGVAGFSAVGVHDTSLAFDNDGKPYVAYANWDIYGKASVMKYNGVAWEQVGEAGFSAGQAGDISLAIDGGTPYVVYQDGGNGAKTSVMKYNGTSWAQVGVAGFSAGVAWYTSLAIDGGTPYVAYADRYSDGKASVMKFNGTAWEQVGAAGFSAAEAWDISLAIDNGTPYVAYQDAGNDYKASVMKYNGTSWEQVGVAGFSAEDAWHTSLAFGRGTPYVAYMDWGNDNKASVMKFASSYHTVTFAGNGADGGSMSDQTSSDPANLTANTFTRTGYTFTGWNTEADSSGDDYADEAQYDFTADITLYAQWSANEFTTTFRSQPKYDGWVLGSGTGGLKDNTAKTVRVGDNALNSQYRAILSFNTASLPDDAEISTVTLHVKRQGVTGGGNPIKTFGGFMVDVKNGTFSKAALQLADFQTKGSQTLGAFKPALSGSGWYSINLTPASGKINTLGITQIRFRFKTGSNNNLVANFLSLYSGNASESKRPQLTVEYELP